MQGIYAIKNKVNGKIYIGRSNNIHRRWLEHKSELRRGVQPNGRLQEEWDKFGEKNFILEILLNTEQNILEKEVEFIEKYDATNEAKGYNLTYGGKKDCPTDHTKKLISDSIKKLWKENKFKGFKGRKHTKENRELMSKLITGKKMPDSFREKRKNYKPSDETKAKMSKVRRRFSKEDIRNMLKLFEKGVSNSEIGRMYNVTPTTIRTIKIGRYYSDITGIKEAK